MRKETSRSRYILGSTEEIPERIMVTAHPDTQNGIKEVPNPIRNLNFVFVVVVVVVEGSVGQDGVAVGRRTSSGLLREMN